MSFWQVAWAHVYDACHLKLQMDGSVQIESNYVMVYKDTVSQNQFFFIFSHVLCFGVIVL